MSRSRSAGRFRWLLLGCWAAVAPAQDRNPLPASPPLRLGLIDSRPAEVEVIPGVRLSGLEVLGVVPGSPAAQAGLDVGDVIFSANARRVVTPNDLRQVLATSEGWLRLKVFQARSEQVLNVNIALGPVPSGPGPVPLVVTGRLRVGVFAVGGETTGTTLTTAAGKSYDLDFGTARPPGPESEGRTAVVTGLLRVSLGPELPGRQIIRVENFRLIGGRPHAASTAIMAPF